MVKDLRVPQDPFFASLVINHPSPICALSSSPSCSPHHTFPCLRHMRTHTHPLACLLPWLLSSRVELCLFHSTFCLPHPPPPKKPERWRYGGLSPHTVGLSSPSSSRHGGGGGETTPHLFKARGKEPLAEVSECSGATEQAEKWAWNLA